MTNSTITSNEIKNLKEVLELIHRLGYTSVLKIQSEDKGLYDALLISLYDAVRNIFFNTAANRSKLAAYTEMTGNHDLSGNSSEDIKLAFFEKMLVPTKRRNGKVTVWLDSILPLPSDNSIRYLQTCANNFIIDRFRAIQAVPVSIDEPLANIDPNSKNIVSLKDTITRRSMIEAEKNLESDCVTKLIMEQIITLLTPYPDELIAFANGYLNKGTCKRKALFEELTATNNPRESLADAICTLIPQYHNAMGNVNLDTDLSSVIRLLGMSSENAEAELSRCYNRAKNRIKASNCLSL